MPAKIGGIEMRIQLSLEDKEWGLKIIDIFLIFLITPFIFCAKALPYLFRTIGDAMVVGNLPVINIIVGGFFVLLVVLFYTFWHLVDKRYKKIREVLERRTRIKNCLRV
ncbi:hypothetical protein COX24_03895 [bacterium (Candidatus Gribaldobacteria) CG23_combo_of_CG06-09_8_20_14_all_37_87_8]|uniref:Uncharacterized protein n=2 Tax=Candidatus Gribaldobacteria TaxID=2798536 RepID=A0A2G9ZDZ1_9BACT|nr:MAG: hypothetical protein AUJ25_03080 [Parcubacteria group bacterium CG1_02_37_13]PIP31386.1 MAG: hypothetical protein COX24_03895 [bacterium (Candidatus Gribaldobacteria) CG23_combo_of_CG06-09_8_20_14_all_37_87_8]PIR90106.1 MAG: hypothetical protein COU05_03120 [bacterium (Candidatus Gribaldobacteria) CG10_big_fil_rev_8_21_14_0_10_37_21]